MITVLAGGVGAARFLEGLVSVVDPARVTVISNVGDDEEFFGLHVSPDIDIVVYTLGGAVDETKGWGLRDEGFACLERLGALGHDTWFALGDRDLATHVHRTALLREGRTLSEATASVAQAFGVRCRLLPVTDDRLRTVVDTDAGMLSFQEYFVKRGWQDEVRAVRFDGVEAARPAPGVIQAIREAEAVIVAPSNPIVSIGPILAVSGVREALRETAAPVVAVSPIVGGRTLKGPADRMLRALGHEPSPAAVAALYADFLDALIVDRVDAHLCERVEAQGVRTVVADTVMRGPREKEALARAALTAAGAIG
ncbi:MAG TPA: 2-phospho-L-lactate transferase [Dehalococcoidia bacterium]|nr:2-phospho-L-lactate transferase [Dehalococcoidia bacterium]